VVAAGLLIAGLRHYRSAPPQEPKSVNNPDQFYLWATNRSFRYTYVYDPHAADVWQFESAGGTSVKTNATGVRQTNSTKSK
jgi:hypothetical protein